MMQYDYPDCQHKLYYGWLREYVNTSAQTSVYAYAYIYSYVFSYAHASAYASIYASTYASAPQKEKAGISMATEIVMALGRIL